MKLSKLSLGISSNLTEPMEDWEVVGYYYDVNMLLWLTSVMLSFSCCTSSRVFMNVYLGLGHRSVGVESLVAASKCLKLKCNRWIQVSAWYLIFKWGVEFLVVIYKQSLNTESTIKRQGLSFIHSYIFYIYFLLYKTFSGHKRVRTIIIISFI